MLDQLFRPQRRCFLLRRIRANLLADEIDSFAHYLRDRGHTLNTTLGYLQMIEHVGTWLRRTGRPAKALNEEVVALFFHHFPRCNCPPPNSRTKITARAAAMHFLRLLRQSGRIPEGMPRATTSIDRAIRDFDRHLVETCGLSLNTRLYRLRHIREFLSRKYGRHPVKPRNLKARDLMDFIADRAVSCTSGTAKLIASSLRSYLRYLQLKGFCDSRLFAATPTIPLWKQAGIPKTISRQDIKCFLNSFDRSSIIGRRDYAMALCLVQCGLRVCEVAQLRLDDIHWREGTLKVPGGKVQRARLLPLPTAVGRAIAAYLRRRRLHSSERALFLRKSSSSSWAAKCQRHSFAAPCEGHMNAPALHLGQVHTLCGIHWPLACSREAPKSKK